MGYTLDEILDRIALNQTAKIRKIQLPLGNTKSLWTGSP
jgi:hypothetical protein